jgi:hypothetical protein
MSAHFKMFLIGCSFACIADATAQRKLACDSILHRAHSQLGSLYSSSSKSEGYAFNINVSATYRDRTIGEVKPQQYRMAVTGGMLLFESENVDSFQDDSVRISVIKTQNRIYIADAEDPATTISYMEQFNALQKILPQFVSFLECKKVEGGNILLRTTIKADTLGLDQVEAMTYVVDKKTNDIHQVAFEFIESNPMARYSIAFSDLVRAYVLPPKIINRYIAISRQSAAGSKQFEQYSIIDNRKKINHD